MLDREGQPCLRRAETLGGRARRASRVGLAVPLSEAKAESPTAMFERFGKTRATATRLLANWVHAGWLVKPEKHGVGAIYLPGPRLLHQPHNASNESEADAMPPETDAMET